MKRRWPLGLIFVLLLPPTVGGRSGNGFERNWWIALIFLGVILLSFISIIFVILTIKSMNRTSEMSKRTEESARELARIAMRLRLSDEARKCIYEYARKQPQFAKLLDSKKGDFYE
ncbi:hypothetical protein V3C99_000460 [Haemonchus contortus]